MSTENGGQVTLTGKKSSALARDDVYVICNHGLLGFDSGAESWPGLGTSENDLNNTNRFTPCGHCNILGSSGSLRNRVLETNATDNCDTSDTSDLACHVSPWRVPSAYSGNFAMLDSDCSKHGPSHSTNSVGYNSSFLGNRALLSSLVKYHSFSSSSPLDTNWIVMRSFHTSGVSCMEEPKSKAEETVKALKEEVSKVKSETPIPLEKVPTGTESAAAPALPKAKKTIAQRIVAELKHYYHGFRLLFIDFRVAIRLSWHVLNGQSLSRRERRQVNNNKIKNFTLTLSPVECQSRRLSTQIVDSV